MSVVELLREIKEKLEIMDKRLSRLEEELLGDELTEEEIKEVEEIIEACKTGKMKVYTLEEAKKELGLE
jgi:cob(I)alamin adenosyltransferase